MAAIERNYAVRVFIRPDLDGMMSGESDRERPFLTRG